MLRIVILAIVAMLASVQVAADGDVKCSNIFQVYTLVRPLCKKQFKSALNKKGCSKVDFNKGGCADYFIDECIEHFKDDCNKGKDKKTFKKTYQKALKKWKKCGKAKALIKKGYQAALKAKF